MLVTTGSSAVLRSETSGCAGAAGATGIRHRWVFRNSSALLTPNVTQSASGTIRARGGSEQAGYGCSAECLIRVVRFRIYADNRSWHRLFRFDVSE